VTGIAGGVVPVGVVPEEDGAVLMQDETPRLRQSCARKNEK
jgi:hypothetical protein